MSLGAESGRRLATATRLAGWGGAVLALTGMALVGGVGVAVLVGRQGEAEAWARWSNVGQTFGALSTVISFLGLAVLVNTARTQAKELRDQRSELERQRAELRRSAESPIMREYWRASESARAVLPEHSDERLTADLVDAVYQELATVTRGSAARVGAEECRGAPQRGSRGR